MLPILTALLLASSPTAAPAKPAPDATPKGEATATAGSKDASVVLRGAPLSGKSKKIAFATLLKDPSAYAGKPVTLEGEVRSACSRKGCWMELASPSDAKGFGARVTFKDYGFFVPTDAQGSRALVEGVVEMTTMSEGMAKHLSEEGAEIPRNADGKPSELRIVATGVELRR